MGRTKNSLFFVCVKKYAIFPKIGINWNIFNLGTKTIVNLLKVKQF